MGVQNKLAQNARGCKIVGGAFWPATPDKRDFYFSAFSCRHNVNMSEEYFDPNVVSESRLKVQPFAFEPTTSRLKVHYSEEISKIACISPFTDDKNMYAHTCIRAAIYVRLTDVAVAVNLFTRWILLSIQPRPAWIIWQGVL